MSIKIRHVFEMEAMTRPRTEMIAETRAKLIAAARQAFGATGYANASMDDFTGEAGLTRGALYQHFGDNKGLLQALIQQHDPEMTDRTHKGTARAPQPVQAIGNQCE